MIISRSYFVSLIDVPNSQDTSPNSDLLGNGIKLDLFIEEHEQEVLIDCLGYSLYAELSNELDSNNSNGLKDTAHQKWNDLLNGKTYEINDIPVKWKGLIFKDKELPRSLIAYYVFCEFLNSDLYSYRGVGVQKEKSKNAIAVSADPLHVASFRKFHKLTEFSNYSNGLKSLYDFIQDMNNLDSDTYLNWHPKRFNNKNLFGI